MPQLLGTLELPCYAVSSSRQLLSHCSLSDNCATIRAYSFQTLQSLNTQTFTPVDWNCPGRAEHVPRGLRRQKPAIGERDRKDRGVGKDVVVPFSSRCTPCMKKKKKER